MFGTPILPIRRVEEHRLAPLERDQWPARVPAVRQLLDEGLDLGPLTILAGENGSGKSTILEAIAEAFGLNAEGGTRNAMHHTQRTESGLAENLQLVRGAGASKKGVFLRAETMHGHLAYQSEINGGRHNFQSHGESFIEFFSSRSMIRGLWLFDEAESAFSFTGCLALVAHITGLIETGSQVIVSTHSPILAAIPGAEILELDEHGFHRCEYDDLELVRSWRQFLDGPDRFLRHLG